MSDVHAVILAGGISSRMGFPKALMPIGTSFFLLTIYERLRNASVEPVHIVINSGLRNSLEAQMFKFPDAQFHLNDQPAKGQIHSLQLGMKAAQEAGAKAIMVSLVDQPCVLKKTFATLLETHQANPDKIIVPSVSGKHGHPVIIPQSKFAAFLDNPENKPAQDIMHAHQDWVEYVAVDDKAVIIDVDSPADLAQLTVPEDEDVD